MRGALASTIADSSSIERNEAPPTSEPTPSSPPSTRDLPHRRRQKARKEAQTQKAPTTSEFLPQNASDTLTTSASAAPSNSIRRLIPVLLSLSKPRLSILVVLTATASYSLYPVPELLLPSSTSTPSLSTLTLLFLTTGTTLCAASANAFNMLYEPKWDALMTRTRNRPLVRGLISTRGAAIFAILAGVTGVLALYYGVNPTTAFLGAANIGLYAGVYTPMKRISVINTWIGAIVGALPPLMGWTAAAGQSATDGGWRELLLGEQNAGGWLLAALLGAWQFPHFMSLSWGIREEYKNAGYRMLSWVNPAKNGRVAFRYSVAMIPVCILLCYAGVTEWSFAVASMPVNLWMVREAWKFRKFEGFKGSARGLFWASVWHLPVVLVLAMVEKKGMWQRVWRAVIGEPDLDDDEWEEDEEDAVLSAKHLSPEAKKAAITMPLT
ncbi:Heme O synthase [Hyphodiscus hymeniophilus]|uniref:Protoheme IX farnesyltransferase, mitochondrial n=1 Tax=Hyphodiscus hymeniophilus TaxID=353542 RepID=A0A9P6VCF5_9HELO|nr:Heme O synthase [Hyphodiscus hymeniophilus]